MSETTTQNARPTWPRRAFAFGLGFGLVFAVAALVAIGVAWLLSTRHEKPRAWNSQAVTAQFAGLEVRHDNENVLCDFQYVFRNNTGDDYRLPGNQSIYKVVRRTKGLQNDGTCEWLNNVEIPLDQPITITLRLRIPYDNTLRAADVDDTLKLEAFLNHRIDALDGFVVLDSEHRFRITLPSVPGLKR